eukprot:699002-Rhodomonas_salina.1
MNEWREKVACAIERYTLLGFNITLKVHQSVASSALDIERCSTTLLAQAFEVAKAKMGDIPPRIQQLSLRDRFDSRTIMPILQVLNTLRELPCLDSLELIGVCAALDCNDRTCPDLRTFVTAFKRLKVKNLSLKDIANDDD